MKISNSLNIDTGHKTGLCIYIAKKNILLGTTLRMPCKSPRENTIKFSNTLETLIKQYDIKVINVEAITFISTQLAFRSHVFFLGLIYATALRTNPEIQINEIPVSTVKSKSTGKLRLSKEGIVDFVNLKIKASLDKKKDQDIADAVLVYLASGGTTKNVRLDKITLLDKCK